VARAIVSRAKPRFTVVSGIIDFVFDSRVILGVVSVL
jgi:hypothetical protein